jgi:hydroxyacylglutathione hydrolase
VPVCPAPGGASACGKALGAVPQSTVGYEKLFNPGVAQAGEQEFVAWVLEGQPEPPRYFTEMKRINRDGPRVLNGFPSPPRLPDARLAELVDAGEVMVDARPARAYARGHVPGTISIPLNASFTTWAGWLIPYDRDFHLIVEDPSVVEAAARALAMIGLDRFAGWLAAESVAAWAAGGRELLETPELDAAELERRLEDDDISVLDVRGVGEYAAGHVPGVPNIPLGYLEQRLDEVPRDRPLVVHCASGARSAIAVSLLQKHGYRDVYNLRDGFNAWRRGGHRVEHGASQAAAAASGR